MSATVPQPISLVRAIRHLCAVDLIRFRWFVSGVLGIELVRALVVEGSLHLAPATAQPRMAPAGAELFVPLLDFGTVVVTAIATAVLVQADHPTDDRAFWRTRPIPPVATAGAKLLAMTLLFVVVPAAINAARLFAYRAPVSALGAATLQIAVLAGVVGVPAWFLAVVTRTLPRFLGAMFGIIVGGYSMIGTLAMLVGFTPRTGVGRFVSAVPYIFDWQHTGIHGWWGGLISTIVGLAIVAAHYHVRRLKVTGAALLLLVLIPSLVPPMGSEQPAPADLAALVDGQLRLPRGLSAMGSSRDGYGPTVAHVNGRIAAPPLPRDVSAVIRIDSIRVQASNTLLAAEGQEQCCLGGGAISLAATTAPDVSFQKQWIADPGDQRAVFRVPVTSFSQLRRGPLDIDAQASVTFARLRVAGVIPLRVGASLRGEHYLLEVLALEDFGGITQVLVRFARFPSMATVSSPRLDLFKVDHPRTRAWFVSAPWPIATYNPGTTVDNWSMGRTWVGHFSFTLEKRGPLPPDADLVVVESTDLGTLHTTLTARDVPIRVPPSDPF